LSAGRIIISEGVSHFFLLETQEKEKESCLFVGGVAVQSICTAVCFTPNMERFAFQKYIQGRGFDRITV